MYNNSNSNCSYVLYLYPKIITYSVPEKKMRLNDQDTQKPEKDIKLRISTTTTVVVLPQIHC